MKEQINRTKHAEELFAAAGFSKQKNERSNLVCQFEI